MTQKQLPYLLLLTLLFFYSCGSKQHINSLKPEPDDASPIVYDNQPSFINLPINVKLKDIENQTNNLLKGLIFEDKDIEDDNLEISVWKLAPITIKNQKGSKNQKIATVLPLKAVIKYRIGTKQFGIEMYDTREFNLNGKINLSSTISLLDWKLKTKTEFKSIDWNESPSMTVLGRSMPITYLIEPGLKLFKDKIEKTIDEAIEKSVNFKPNVFEALEKISTPFEVNKDYKTWLRITPIELYATDARLNKDSFLIDMGLKCDMETIIGNQLESKFDASKIVLKSVSRIPNQISANIIAVSTYDQASKIMTQNFSGQEFGSGSKKIKVLKVALWHKTGKLVIALDVLGAVNGTLYLAGIPKYNDDKKEIYFDDLEYVLDTKSKVIRTASWLAQGLILNKIKEACKYSIKPNLDEGKKSMTGYLDNYSPMAGVFVNGKLEDIEFQKIQLTNNALLAFVKIKGAININVDGLK